jgi:hypothetical protein
VSSAALVGSCFTDVQDSSSSRRTSGKAVHEECKRQVKVSWCSSVTAWFLEDGNDGMFQNVSKRVPTNTAYETSRVKTSKIK